MDQLKLWQEHHRPQQILYIVMRGRIPQQGNRCLKFRGDRYTAEGVSVELRHKPLTVGIPAMPPFRTVIKRHRKRITVRQFKGLQQITLG